MSTIGALRFIGRPDGSLLDADTAVLQADRPGYARILGDPSPTADFTTSEPKALEGIGFVDLRFTSGR